MTGTVRPTRPRDLLAAAAVAAVVTHLLLRLAYGSLPPLPALAGVPLLLFAIGEAVFGATLRARIRRRPGTRPVQALLVAQAVALAKASSLAGAVTAGAWLGVLGYVLPRRAELTAAASDTTAAVVGALGAGALVAAGLWLEHCCRAPDGPDPHDPRDPDPRPAH